MRQYWILAALVLVAFQNRVESRTLVKRQANPAGIDFNIGHEGFQDKAKVEATFGIKNAVLGFVFNKFAAKPTTNKPATTTEDIVIFKKGEKVSLDVPGELFSSSYTLVTNLSNTVGDFMINSALRAQRLLESMRPFLHKILGSKGLVIEATTDKPIFSDPNTV